ncbi:MAG: ribulokinase [Planctomycetota bacterium]
MPASRKPAPKFSVGVDYGTNSVRALIVNTADGTELAEHVFNYPSGTDGILLDPKDPLVARQHPGDYLKGFVVAVREAVKKAKGKRGFKPERVVGLGVDTTGSTPIPVDESGQALGLQKKFRKNLAAQAWLWKDHTGHEEAAEITAKAAKSKTKYLDKCGGVYSSEWYWSKILRCRRVAPGVFAAAYGWVEMADYIPGWLTGKTDPDTMTRNICAAGHKAMYHDDWGGLPSKAFLKSLHPDLAALRDRYAAPAAASDQPVGGLLGSIAKEVGLPAGLPVAAGLFDAHAGAVGSGVKPGTLVKIMGTSTCDISVWPGDADLADIPGLCGIVPGSVIPGMYGLEAGQSAVGDIFNWFVRCLTPGDFGTGGEAHTALTKAAGKLVPGASGLIALDWNNGNRTVLVDPLLSGLLVGQTLHTTAPEVYRALIEATAFGARIIIDRFEQYGVKIKEVINCGGIAEKNPMAMQIYADVCNRPMKISASAQTCALGSAIFGAVVGKAHNSTSTAVRKMTGTKAKVYRPIKKNVAVYEKLYRLYADMHDAFGGQNEKAALAHVMKELIAIRDAARKG